MIKSINKNKVLVIAVAVLIIALIVVLLKDKIRKNSNEYSVVYLTSGEVYIGKLTTFPNLELENSYLLNVTKDASDPNKNNFQLQPVSDAIWAPKEIHLIKKNVVFYGKLSSDSKIAQTLKEQIK
jgi:hypothetical protein